MSAVPSWLSEYASEDDEPAVGQEGLSWLQEYAEDPSPAGTEKPIEAPVDTFARVSQAITESAPYAIISNMGRTGLGNFADEIGAAGRSAYDIAASDEYEMSDYGALYNYNKGQIQDHYAEIDSASPIAAPVGSVAGAVTGGPALAAGKFISGATSAIPIIGRSIFAGAGEGALLAAGEADENIGEAVQTGAKYGAAGGGAGAVVGFALGEIGKRVWRGLSRNQKEVAIKTIRERAREYGVDADEVVKMYQSNPEMTLADVDASMKDMARGLGQRNPEAMNEGRRVLTERNAGAPARIGRELEEATGTPLGRADEIEVEAEAARRELGPSYDEINEAPVPMGDRRTWAGEAAKGERVDGVSDELAPYLPLNTEASPARKIIQLMPEEYNAALTNYRRKIGNPDFDPEVEGYIPGAMIQDMKVAANRTQNSPTASGAAQQGARSVNERLLETADEYIEGYGPLRREYGQRVMAPEEGLDLAGGYFNGGWERLKETMEQAHKLSPEGKEAFDAGVVRAADRAVRDAPGAKGTQFFGAPLLRNETAGQRLDDVIPADKRSLFDEAIEAERTMHTTMSEVTGVGSPTAQNQAANTRLGQDGPISFIQDISSSFIDKLSRSESQTEAMKILLDSGMDEKALRELLDSPYIGKPVRDVIHKMLSTGSGNAAMGAMAGSAALSGAMQ